MKERNEGERLGLGEDELRDERAAKVFIHPLSEAI